METSMIRNVAFISHGGAGKTSLIEAVLYNTGATQKIGNIESGTSVMDFDQIEIERKFSINAKVASIAVPFLIISHGSSTIQSEMESADSTPAFSIGTSSASSKSENVPWFMYCFLSFSDVSFTLESRVKSSLSDSDVDRLSPLSRICDATMWLSKRMLSLIFGHTKSEQTVKSRLKCDSLTNEEGNECRHGARSVVTQRKKWFHFLLDSV